MPDGNRCGSARIFPLLSRPTCQQSSMTTYSYPAACIPLLTMASAASRINCSLTLQPNLFQLFHPIGGVPANMSSAACAPSRKRSELQTAMSNHASRLEKLHTWILPTPYLFRDAAILRIVGSVSISSSLFGRGILQLGRVSSRAPGKLGLLSAATPSSKEASVITAGDR